MCVEGSDGRRLVGLITDCASPAPLHMAHEKIQRGELMLTRDLKDSPVLSSHNYRDAAIACPAHERRRSRRDSGKIEYH